MKKLNSIMTKACAGMGTLLVAVVVAFGVTPASLCLLYQPKAPKCLK